MLTHHIGYRLLEQKALAMQKHYPGFKEILLRFQEDRMEIGTRAEVMLRSPVACTKVKRHLDLLDQRCVQIFEQDMELQERCHRACYCHKC